MDVVLKRTWPSSRDDETCWKLTAWNSTDILTSQCLGHGTNWQPWCGDPTRQSPGGRTHYLEAEHWNHQVPFMSHKLTWCLLTCLLGTPHSFISYLPLLKWKWLFCPVSPLNFEITSNSYMTFMVLREVLRHLKYHIMIYCIITCFLLHVSCLYPSECKQLSEWGAFRCHISQAPMKGHDTSSSFSFLQIQLL